MELCYVILPLIYPVHTNDRPIVEIFMYVMYHSFGCGVFVSNHKNGITHSKALIIIFDIYELYQMYL